MKHILIIFLTIILNNRLLSQTINVQVGYPLYLINLPNKSKPIEWRDFANISGVIGYSKYFAKFKFDFGFEYASKKYSYTFSDPNYKLERITEKLNHLYFPIHFNRRILIKNQNILSLNFGLLIIESFGYSIIETHKSGEKIENKNLSLPNKFGHTLQFGVRYSRKISTLYIFYSELYLNYKFNLDVYEGASSDLYPIPNDDRFNLGLKIGIERIINDKMLKYFDDY
jgi:hypothetical protein